MPDRIANDTELVTGPGSRPQARTVLYVIDELTVGGSEQQLLCLIERMDRARYRPIVCVFRGMGRIAAAIARLGVPVLQVPKRSRYDWSVVPSLCRIIRRERVDVVHTFLWTANTWGRIAALLGMVPVIIASERNVDPWKRWYHHLIDRLLARGTTVIIANAEAVKRFVVDVERISEQLVTVILNGIDAARFPPRETRPRQVLRVGYLGRLEPQKGLELFLAVAEEFRGRAAEVRFAVGGGGSLQTWLHDQVVARDLGEVLEEVGEVDDPERYLRNLDIFLLTSHREGLANVLLEAGLCELPAVVTSVGGNGEVVKHGETGFVIPPADAVAAISAVWQLLGNETLRRQMGQAARRRIVSEFAVDRMVRDTVRWYR